MRVKGFIILVMIFGILLLLVFQQKKKEQKSFDEMQAAGEVLFYPEFDPDRVAHIKVLKVNDSVDMIKEGGYWMVSDIGMTPMLMEKIDESTDDGEEGAEIEGPPPDPEYKYYRAEETLVIDGLLNAIDIMKREERVSHDPGKHTSFYVLNSIVGIEVLAEDADGNELAHLIVGKASEPIPTYTYVRDFNEDDVYQVKQPLQNMLSIPFNAWRDKIIFNFDKGSINRLTFKHADDGDLEFIIDENGAWSGVNVNWNVNGSNLDSVLDKFSYLRASDFAPPHLQREEMGLTSPEQSLIASGLEGSYELILGALSDTGLYYCTAGHDESVFTMNEPDIRAIFIGKDKLELIESLDPDELADSS